MKGINDKNYLEELKQHYEFLIRKQKEELKHLPAGELGIRAGNNKHGYVQYRHYVDGKIVGITKDIDLIELLTRKKFIQKSLKNLESNYVYLARFLEKYKDVNEDHIIAQFPYHYAVLMNKDEAKWNEKKRQWLAENFDQSTSYPEEKVHVTAKGLHVRSKSEVIIAERLDYYHVPYRYEETFYIKNYKFSPDFTILTKKGTVYWEHCGKTHDLGYMRNHNWRCTMYESIGIVPWKNYIVTYDDENGNIDTRIIDSEIVNKLL